MSLILAAFWDEEALVWGRMAINGVSVFVIALLT